jgi:peptidoglycan/xylan/chitin deacetylase (PgdA/CDA1 family)
MMSRFISLMYHNLEPGRANSYAVSSKTFREQLAWLTAEGYVIEGFPGLERRLACWNFPARYVVLSFDDGHRSNLEAASILREYGAQATFFLTRDFCRQLPDFLQADEIRALAQLCSVGSHGISHAPLSRLSATAVRAELTASRVWLEDLVGAAVTSFSAPGGFINRQVLHIALGLGYRLAGNSVDWWCEPAQVERSRLVNRVAVRQGMTLPSFASLVRGKQGFLVRRRLRAGVLELAKRVLPLQQYDRLSRNFYRAIAALPHLKI